MQRSNLNIQPELKLKIIILKYILPIIIILLLFGLFLGDLRFGYLRLDQSSLHREGKRGRRIF